jgi:hypothetical protein
MSPRDSRAQNYLHIKKTVRLFNPRTEMKPIKCNKSAAEHNPKTETGTDKSLIKMLIETLSLFLFPEKKLDAVKNC